MCERACGQWAGHGRGVPAGRPRQAVGGIARKQGWHPGRPAGWTRHQIPHLGACGAEGRPRQLTQRAALAKVRSGDRCPINSSLRVYTSSDSIPDHTLRVRNMRSEEHTSELQSLMRISYAVFCLKKKNSNKYYKLNNVLNTTSR